MATENTMAVSAPHHSILSVPTGDNPNEQGASHNGNNQVASLSTDSEPATASPGSNGSIVKMPAELSKAIFGNLGKTDLKQARLVSTQLERAANPFLFTTLSVRAESSSLMDAMKFLDRFSDCIKCVVVSPIGDHRYWKKSEFKKVTRSTVENGLPWTRLFQWANHCEAAHEVDVDGADDAVFILRSEADRKLLKQSFEKCPHLRKVVITTDRPYALTEKGLRQFCHSEPEKCHFSLHDHANFSNYGDSISRYRVKSYKKFTSFLFENMHIATNLQELVIADDTIAHLLEPSTFEPSSKAFTLPPNAFSNLTKLELAFGHGRDDLLGKATVNRAVAKALQQARSLRCLLVDLGKSAAKRKLYKLPAITTFEIVLGNCFFPKLKACAVIGGQVTGKEITDFVCRHTGVETLLLCRLNLLHAQWNDVVDRIQQTPGFNLLDIYELRPGYVPGGWQRSSRHHRQWFVDFTDKIHPAAAHPSAAQAGRLYEWAIPDDRYFYRRSLNEHLAREQLMMS